MVPQLPYFMIQFDHKGERGYGHVIEGAEAGEAFEQQDEYGMSEAAMGGGKFDRWFGESADIETPFTKGQGDGIRVLSAYEYPSALPYTRSCGSHRQPPRSRAPCLAQAASAGPSRRERAAGPLQEGVGALQLDQDARS